MTRFDQEMKLFEEIKNKYKPIEGYHLILDLDAYRKSKEMLFKFKIGSEVYRLLVNSKYANGNKECVIISGNVKKTIVFDSKILYLEYDFDRNVIVDFFDKAPNPYKLNRSLKHQMKLLVFDLTHPKSEKPAC